MAGTRYGNGVNVFSVALLCHYFGPVVIIFFKGTIGHLHGNRGTGCFAKAYAGRDFGSIFLKSHSSTPSVSFLPTSEMKRYLTFCNGQPGRQAFTNSGELGSVRFACSYISYHALSECFAVR